LLYHSPRTSVFYSLSLYDALPILRAGLNRVVNAAGDNNSAGVTGDEIRKTFDLKPGARVDIQGINGRVEIQTSDTKTAEVFVKRSEEHTSELQSLAYLVCRPLLEK